MTARKRTWKALVALGAAIVAVLAWFAYTLIAGPVTGFHEDSRLLFVPTGSDIRTAEDSLQRIGALGDRRLFRALAERGRIKPGRYRVRRGMSVRTIVRMLHAGEQEPLRVTFSNVDDLSELAGRLGRSLEPDSLAFLQAFLDPEVQARVGLDEANMIALFLPNTYELWWTTTPERFIERMRTEHDAFWDARRRARAATLGLTPAQVSTLASIVQAETVRMTDAPAIAGVYLNRLRIGMPLQADPTVKFALGLDSVQRVLHRDISMDSPYNTYRRIGLPPGPIGMAETRFIDAVLDAPEHDYLYFCARADMSGYSDFTRSYEQHLVNARRYQRALNERGIRR
jgi:UPF0755 protein